MISHNERLQDTSREDCPPADVLIDLVTYNLTLKVRRNTDEHLKSCKLCMNEVKALQNAFDAKFGPLPKDHSDRRAE